MKNMTQTKQINEFLTDAGEKWKKLIRFSFIRPTGFTLQFIGYRVPAVEDFNAKQHLQK